MSDSEDRCRGHLPIDAQTMRQLYRPKPGALAWAVTLTYVALAVSFSLALGTRSVLAYAMAVAIAVAVQTRFAIIMHEGAHYLLHPNRRVNDRLTNWLAAFPIGTTVEMYRCNHLRHHNHLGTPEDPDFAALCLPPIENGLGSSVLGCLTGWRQLQLLLKYITGQRQTARPAGAPGLSGLAGRAVWHGVLLGTATLAGHPLAYVFVWLVPLLTFGVLINEVRSIVEHTPLVNGLATGELRSLEPLTRTVRPGWLDRLWIAPLNFSYHLEHHLYPGVPFSRLPELHRVLKGLGYYEQRPDLLHAGYGSIVRALAGCFRQRESRPQVQVENGTYVAHRA